LPAHSNWPLVGALSRGGYRFLLEHGVRVFEWQGPMIHAKTAVVDGIWSRWELDVGVLDTGLASQLEGLFLGDLATSSEIVLPRRLPSPPFARQPGERESPQESLDPQGTLPQRLERRLRARGATAQRMGMAPLVRAGSALGGALAGNRTLGREDRVVLGLLAAVAFALALAAALVPALVGWLVAALGFWFGVVLALRAIAQARQARSLERRAREAADRAPDAGGPP
jgi:hypothetical protein